MLLQLIDILEYDVISLFFIQQNNKYFSLHFTVIPISKLDFGKNNFFYLAKYKRHKGLNPAFFQPITHLLYNCSNIFSTNWVLGVETTPLRHFHPSITW